MELEEIQRENPSTTDGWSDKHLAQADLPRGDKIQDTEASIALSLSSSVNGLAEAEHIAVNVSSEDTVYEYTVDTPSLLSSRDEDILCSENVSSCVFARTEEDDVIIETSTKTHTEERCTSRFSNGKVVTKEISADTEATELGKRRRNIDEDRKSKKLARRQPPVYGNYFQYYNYRVLDDIGEDPRLKYFKREWFDGRDCLDVGCNAGNLTLSIASKFRCKSMEGIDIDTGLINRANRLLQKVARGIEKNHNYDQLEMLNNEITANDGNHDLRGEELLRKVSFRAENFISHWNFSPCYDTVLCLSVTKWVHLNWGDAGLMKLFGKIRNLLRPGGILVLEPQPWKSYQSNHLISEVVRKNYHTIILRPDDFKDILLDKIGFRSMECITDEIDCHTKGFNRPIYILRC
ncbi:hypothetical protein KP509_39G040600 [Ceratopteris richardii]|uniref:RNA methyltransferase n=1 Tax=Ceratopteris richardii TaxID=49495 RepID=A0A8T2Q0P3_CERRI|nr:hypothetical protein KP509_39G040600 [Ceratopteris richardii]KAH7277220.1 hypothetical protein KP509_39G040600 [Ceratopteris richardii]KAH7277221.1 hypothetical protein KP509_39G040600 [Ceratopteris richardii]